MEMFVRKWLLLILIIIIIIKSIRLAVGWVALAAESHAQKR